MGIVVVAFLAANALGGPPGAKITDTRSARCGSPAATAPRLRVQSQRRGLPARVQPIRPNAGL